MRKALVFAFFYIIFAKVGIGQNPETTTPTYSHLGHADLPTVTSTELNSNDLTIAIATGPQNFVYVLTFGNGVQKRDANGNIIKSNFITGLDSPFDIAVDEDGFIYIADFFASGDYHDNGQVKIYDSNGNYVRSILTSYYRPMGIDVDENYVYIAEYNDGKKGPESTPSSRIRIVDKATGNALKTNTNVSLPYRIANDSKGNVYVSQEGGGNRGVYIFDSNLSAKGKLSNIQSPGSVVIDDFDFIHVIEYAGKIDFGEFITSTDDFFYLLGVTHTIYDAVKAQTFGVKIFTPNYQFKTFYKEEVHFPLDIAFNHCDRMYIDDSEIFGNHVDKKIGPLRVHTFVPSRLEFDLEIYQRTPAFDVTAPEIICPESFKQYVDEGQDYATVTFDPPTVLDQNDFTIEQTAGLTSGSQFPLGDNTIEYTAIDLCGNESTCTFIITVKSSEQPPSFQNCSGDISVSNDPGECGAITTFPTPTASDENGVVEVIRGDTSGLNSGDVFPVGTTTIIFTATDDQGNTSTCEFDILVSDDEDPVFSSCPAPVDVTIQEGEVYKIPDFADSAVASDNCGNPTISQDIAAGTEITTSQSFTVTLTATDAAGNSDTCSVDVMITVQKRPFTCNDAGSITLQLDNNGEAQLQLNDIIDATGDTTGYNFNWKQNFTCDDAGKVQDVTLSFTNGEDSGECIISVEVLDIQDPVINCPADQTGSFPAGGSYTIPDFTQSVGASDNCEITAITQDPVAGTKVTSDTLVTLTAEDTSGRTDECSFMVTVTEIEAPKIDCITNYAIYASENCEYFVPDFSTILDYTPSDAVITQDVEAGSLIDPNSDPYITVTATYNDQTDICNVYLEFKDDTDPVISCPGEQTAIIAPNSFYTIPDYTAQANASDNCGISEIIQEPGQGTQVSSDTAIKLTAVDDSGNTAFCTFQLVINVEEDLAVNCPGDQEFSLDQNCSFELPDFTGEAEVVNGNGLTVSQSPPAGTIITDSSTTVELSVEKDGESAECSFTVTLHDNIPPEAHCKGSYEIILKPGETYVLDPSEIDAGSNDYCSNVTLSLSQTEFTAADQGEVKVELTATDEAGNSLSCETIISVIVDTEDNQKPVANPDEYSTQVNTVLNVNASEGVLKNDSDPEEDALTAVLDQDVSNGNLELNADGSFNYTPNAGFLGEDFFIYHVNDDQNNSENVMVIINVQSDSGNFACALQVVVGIGSEGSFTLPIENLYSGNAAGLDISASQLTFTCEDIGDTSVTLTYSGRLNGSCEIPVEVIDDASPVLRVKDISIDLDLEGIASIDFDDIDNGSFDGCDEKVTYTLSQSVFTCKDVGENTILVTAEDNNGNTTTAEVRVKVFAEAGICDEPVEGSEYIFIYPNPNSGHFKIATPADVSISRIEVFDHRGRFIAARTYAENENTYEMELGPLQEAVYVLKLTTNEGGVMKRFIFKN